MMGLFESNAGLFFAAILVVGAVGGFVGRKIEAFIGNWRDDRVRR